MSEPMRGKAPRPWRAVRYLWAAPTTLVGVALAALACALGATPRRVAGTVEVAGGAFEALLARLPARLRFDAITLGHVIVGVDHARLARVRAHEHVHVAQCERWGPLFLPAYLIASLVAWIGGRDPYRGNRFEQEAFACERSEEAATWARR
jgi:hypothetical protein